MIGITDVIPLLVFIGIVVAIWAVLSMISSRNSQALERLARLSRPQSLADIEDPTRARGDHKLQGLIDAAKSISRPLMPSFTSRCVGLHGQGSVSACTAKGLSPTGAG